MKTVTTPKWSVGCSGFSYKEWKGVFYPPKLPQRNWFEFYAVYFKTLELNVTFYRFPQESMLQSWYSKSPEGFSFAVKVPKVITHMKQLNETDDLLADFYATIKNGLKEKLGPVLFQFPPRFIYTEERLQKIISAVDHSCTNVVEFRHSSWWCEEVYTQLKKHKIVFCNISYPGLPEDVIVTSSIVYYRFHGVPKLYYSAYTEQELKSIADDISHHDEVKKVYCYFNNTAAVGAIENAQFLQEKTSKKEKQKVHS